jgi:DNA-binding GntR family transcriptional regulator
LYRRAALPRTAAIVSSLLRHAERFTRMQLAFTEALERAEAEHRQIVDLCRRGRVDDAAAVLAEHIQNACETLVAYITTRTARSDTPEPT